MDTAHVDRVAGVDPQWRYDALAARYELRPDYEPGLIGDTLRHLRVSERSAVLEVGAGTGKLTQHLCASRCAVVAIEPSAAMRLRGQAKPALRAVQWLAAVGESLPFDDDRFDLIAYGSSFNCLRAEPALREAARVLRRDGHLVALWNYRDLDDPLQASIEAMLEARIERYDRGSRRDAPMAHPLLASAFADLRVTERRFVVEVDAGEWVDAWHAHGTLARQAGPRLPEIVEEIRGLVGPRRTIAVPYVTRVWTAMVAK